ncbi:MULTISPECIES: dihydropteroate synthase [unclassified Devosia]|uniref:dihydropteroate synthase n=1 Tax=unclassified Devosia TaxID=196773 RepID=UPI00086C7BEA|nr:MULTISPECIES: dihydropteroate synthase [unclassified Devosia]MBN9361546.1 dihydropteroate synthase [Devosia sp.]ODS95184.1 MAG: dihydropteroate synthase [Devosia sp. SCN 66-27]OJX26605.1 MAG: dihydropteroate synthase [Devosia sp. 66-14]
MPVHREYELAPAGATLRLGRRARLMGILNVTPDSFSDGGRFDAVPAALGQARRMLAEGADIIDIGGESTRPGAAEVSAADELARVLPAIAALRADGIVAPISIDTYKAEVAEQAIAAGATIINDVHGLQREPELAAVAASRGVPLVVMHWDKARDASRDVMAEMARYFEVTLRIADEAGVAPSGIVLDPGFGFAKSLSENYEILHRLPELVALGFPVLVGTSRKSMIGRLLDVPADERLAGTVATSVLGYTAGAHLFRVHDIRPNRDALRVAEAALYGPQDQDS